MLERLVLAAAVAQSALFAPSLNAQVSVPPSAREVQSLVIPDNSHLQGLYFESNKALVKDLLVKNPFNYYPVRDFARNIPGATNKVACFDMDVLRYNTHSLVDFAKDMQSQSKTGMYTFSSGYQPPGSSVPFLGISPRLAETVFDRILETGLEFSPVPFGGSAIKKMVDLGYKPAFEQHMAGGLGLLHAQERMLHARQAEDKLVLNLRYNPEVRLAVNDDIETIVRSVMENPTLRASFEKAFNVRLVTDVSSLENAFDTIDVLKRHGVLGKSVLDFLQNNNSMNKDEIDAILQQAVVNDASEVLRPTKDMLETIVPEALAEQGFSVSPLQQEKKQQIRQWPGIKERARDNDGNLIPLKYDISYLYEESQAGANIVGHLVSIVDPQKGKIVKNTLENGLKVGYALGSLVSGFASLQSFSNLMDGISGIFGGFGGGGFEQAVMDMLRDILYAVHDTHNQVVAARQDIQWLSLRNEENFSKITDKLNDLEYMIARGFHTNQLYLAAIQQRVDDINKVVYVLDVKEDKARRFSLKAFKDSQCIPRREDARILINADGFWSDIEIQKKLTSMNTYALQIAHQFNMNGSEFDTFDILDATTRNSILGQIPPTMKIDLYARLVGSGVFSQEHDPSFVGPVFSLAPQMPSAVPNPEELFVASAAFAKGLDRHASRIVELSANENSYALQLGNEIHATLNKVTRVEQVLGDPDLLQQGYASYIAAVSRIRSALIDGIVKEFGTDVVTWKNIDSSPIDQPSELQRPVVDFASVYRQKAVKWYADIKKERDDALAKDTKTPPETPPCLVFSVVDRLHQDDTITLTVDYPDFTTYPDLVTWLHFNKGAGNGGLIQVFNDVHSHYDKDRKTMETKKQHLFLDNVYLRARYQPKVLPAHEWYGNSLFQFKETVAVPVDVNADGKIDPSEEKTLYVRTFGAKVIEDTLKSMKEPRTFLGHTFVPGTYSIYPWFRAPYRGEYISLWERKSDDWSDYYKSYFDDLDRRAQAQQDAAKNQSKPFTPGRDEVNVAIPSAVRTRDRIKSNPYRGPSLRFWYYAYAVPQYEQSTLQSISQDLDKKIVAAQQEWMIPVLSRQDMLNQYERVTLVDYALEEVTRVQWSSLYDQTVGLPSGEQISQTVLRTTGNTVQATLDYLSATIEDAQRLRDQARLIEHPDGWLRDVSFQEMLLDISLKNVRRHINAKQSSP